MLGFSAKLPVTDDERQWVDQGFARLEHLLGRRRILECRVITPTAEDFPDAYDKTPAAAEKLFRRVCSYMSVDLKEVDLEVFSHETEELSKILPEWRSDGQERAAGLFFHGSSQITNAESAHIIAIRSTELQDPMTLVATIAHELGHVVLLGRKLLSPTTPDHEPLTDLLTVFLGLGVFTANSAARFKQWQDERRFGWSMNRLGYLPEEVFGYALAKFAAERNEKRPEWMGHLSTNVKAYCKKSLAWLAENPQYVAMGKPIGQ